MIVITEVPMVSCSKKSPKATQSYQAIEHSKRSSLLVTPARQHLPSRIVLNDQISSSAYRFKEFVKEGPSANFSGGIDKQSCFWLSLLSDALAL